MIWLGLLIIAVIAVSLLYPKNIGDRIAFTLMLPVLGYTLWFFIDWELLPINDILAILLTGVLLGVALFALGLPISSSHPLSLFRDGLHGIRTLVTRTEQSSLLLYQAITILYEELIWRVFLTGALLTFAPIWIVVLFSAILFWAVHKENRPIGPHSIEFFIFTLVLTGAYLYSGSLLLAWTIHAIRNLFILGARIHQQIESLEDREN